MLERSPGPNPLPLATPVARLFFPQSKALGIDLQSLSPGLLKKVAYAGSNSVSFQQASQFLLHLADQEIKAPVVRRTTERIGDERLAERDIQVASFLELPLAQRNLAPCNVPDLAVVMSDGGRIQIRHPDDSPDCPDAVTNAEPGGAATVQATPATDAAAAPCAAESAAEEPEEIERKERHWREDKVGLLMTMKSEVLEADPCPELPETFRDPLIVLKLAREIGLNQAVAAPGTFESAADKEEEDEATAQSEEAASKTRKRPGCPEVKSKRVIATRQKNPQFGPILAAVAWSLGMLAAPRGAYVGDGSAANWSVQKKYFPHYIPIVDFIHVMSYVFAAALAGREFAVGWEVYQEWISWVWKGEVERVLAALRQRREELEEGSAARKSVETSLVFPENQKGRMAYGEYRKAGLPIMSSYIESAVKQIGRRVKGTEKFWNEEGAEAILQLRGDYLSDDEPLDHGIRAPGKRSTGFTAWAGRCSR